ncbi:hypothetical protein CP532_6034 [Ophiocordyceps camponoti-leonardi (nom. inval.)]|nr:hypothetical protein CP532_6034 [Ophiocordyceps camponoti-leonardi (nom. inval.)]
MPRLVNRGNAYAGATTTTTTTTRTSTLPPYEPPQCEPDEEAKRKLSDLANNRGHALYEAQVKECLRQLNLSVRDLNERLYDQRERLTTLRSRRAQKGLDISEEENRLCRHLDTFENHVDRLTRRSEAAVRDCIDKGAELEDEAAILQQLASGNIAASSTEADDNDDDEQDEDNDDDGENPDRKPSTSAPSILKAYSQARSAKLAAYEDDLSAYQRYAVQNDYIAFKKSWHDAVAGKDGPPLADASKWFRPDGQPVMDRRPHDGSARRRSGADGDDVEDGDDDDVVGGDDEDDDDEIAVAREVISVNCPLTLRPMVEPYSNKKCKHTFERSAIVDYLSSQREMQCPQTGCSAKFSRDTFHQDFHLDEAILRRIQREKETRRNRVLDDDDIEDE